MNYCQANTQMLKDTHTQTNNNKKTISRAVETVENTRTQYINVADIKNIEIETKKCSTNGSTHQTNNMTITLEI